MTGNGFCAQAEITVTISAVFSLCCFGSAADVLYILIGEVFAFAIGRECRNMTVWRRNAGLGDNLSAEIDLL